MSSYYNPVKIIQTGNWLHELNKNIQEFNISYPIIITTPGNRERLKLDSIFNSDSIFSDIGSNPNFEDCTRVINFCQKNTYDGVIAIGGGSAMDLAKVVMAYLCLDKTDINDLINYKNEFPIVIPSIFLPTTHGTASEVTMWGTIWNEKEEKKYSISHYSLYPTVAILDGNLTLSLPLNISIMTTMDALSHSFEAIWNKRANKKSTDYAISAISTILNKAHLLKGNSNDISLRNELLYASTTAGLAFSNTATAAAHSISYPLTLKYNIPHGIASSITLLPLLDRNSKLISSPLKRICDNNGIDLETLKEIIRNIPKNIIRFSLIDWGIPEKDLQNIADASFTKGRMENNIRDLSKKEVLSILKEIYSI